MPILDIIILIIIALFMFAGLRLGLFHTIGSLIGTIVGVFVASRYYEPLAQWSVEIFGKGINISRVVVFVLIFFVLTRAIGVVFLIIGKLVSLLLPIPFKSAINRFLGMIFGGVEALLLIGVTIFFIDKFPLSETVMHAVSTSAFAPHALNVASILIPLFPDALRALDSALEIITTSV